MDKNSAEGSRRRPVRRLLKIVIILLIAIELIWVIGANWALRSDMISGLINKKPHKLLVEWDGGSTFIPGLVTVEGLTVIGQSKKQQYAVEMERARVRLSLLAFANKTFKTYSVDGTGIDFRLRKRPLPDQPPGPAAEFSPEIEVSAGEDPPVDVAKKAKKAEKKPWKLSLGGIHLRGDHRIWVLAYRLTGGGTIRAKMSVELRGGDLAVQRARINLADAEIWARGNTTMQDLDLDIDARLEPFSPKGIKGFEVAGSMSGSVGLKGRVTGSQLFNSLLGDFDAVRLDSPGSDLDGVLHIAQGRWVEPSKMILGADDGWIDILDWRAGGPAAFNIGVAGSGEETKTEVSFVYRDVAVTNRKVSQPLLDQASLELHALAGEIDASLGIEGMRSALQKIQFDLKEARVSDITQFPLPPMRGLALEGGSVVVNSHAELTRGTSVATLDVSGTGLQASGEDSTVTGDLTIDLDMTTDDLKDREFDFSNSSFQLNNVAITAGEERVEDWYLHVDLTSGKLRLAEPGSIYTSVEMRMKDTRPIIAAFGQQKKIIEKLSGMLTFEDVNGEANLEMGAKTFEVEDVGIATEGLQIMANMRIGGNQTEGILYTKFHGLPIAVDMRGGSTNIVIIKPKSWYEKQEVPWQGRTQ